MSAGFPFHWTTKRNSAAQLVADHQLTDTEIAKAVGVTQRQLERWKQRPEFRDRVASIVEETRVAILRHGIASREKRVEFLNERHILMRRVIDERAADPALADVPGGTTGLLVHQIKQIGSGKDAQAFDEYAVDTGLLKELREHEKQAAQELGQWTEKQDVTSGGEPVRFTLKLSNDGNVRVRETAALSEAE